jgi:hypothetical protein
MPSYSSFMCPNCEGHFRVIWPEPLPNYTDPCSKIKIKCPDCGEVTELYAYLIDRILQAPEPGIPSIEIPVGANGTRWSESDAVPERGTLHGERG